MKSVIARRTTKEGQRVVHKPHAKRKGRTRHEAKKSRWCNIRNNVQPISFLDKPTNIIRIYSDLPEKIPFGFIRINSDYSDLGAFVFIRIIRIRTGEDP